MTRPKNHDDYLAALPAAQRAALESLRAQIRAAAPEAEEVFSYGIPAFRQGKGIAGYAAMKNHCGLYAFDEGLFSLFADELTEFSTSTGTIRFTSEHPVPEDLVRRIVRSRRDRIG